MKIVILGTGWVGKPLAMRLSNEHEVWALKRSFDEDLHQKLGNRLLQMTWQEFSDIDHQVQWDLAVCLLPPSAFNLHKPEEINRLMDKIDRQADHFFMASSTSVYPDKEAEFTEQDAERIVSKHSGVAMLDVEEVLTQSLTIPYSIFRLGGLVGYERKPFARWENADWKGDGGLVNFVHRDDVVGAFCAGINQKAVGVFNVVAPKHPSRRSLRNRFFNLQNEQQIHSEKREGRVVSAAKLSRVLGYEFIYPDPFEFPEIFT